MLHDDRGSVGYAPTDDYAGVGTESLHNGSGGQISIRQNEWNRRQIAKGKRSVWYFDIRVD